MSDDDESGDLAKGCVKTVWPEEEKRIGADGAMEMRTRNCFKVESCANPANNIPATCGPWSEWRPA